MEVYKLKCCAASNIPRKISNILEVLKLEAQVEDFAPEPDRIHLANGTLMLDGSFTPGRPDIVRNRLPVAYNPNAPQLDTWLRILEELLYPEDIPTLQEYIGYFLIPSNKCQRMMIIKGSGPNRRSRPGREDEDRSGGHFPVGFYRIAAAGGQRVPIHREQPQQGKP